MNSPTSRMPMPQPGGGGSEGGDELGAMMGPTSGVGIKGRGVRKGSFGMSNNATVSTRTSGQINNMIEIMGTWKLTYIGNVSVPEEAGDGTVMDAYEQVSKNPFDSHHDPCAIRVSARTLRVTNEQDKTSIDSAYIRIITYIAVVGDDVGTKVFGYISKNHALGLLRCWLFTAPDAVCMEVSKAVAKAFKLAPTLPNPFHAPADQELVNPPTTLARSEIRRHFLTSTGVVGSGQFGEVHLAMMDEAGRHGVQGDMTVVAVKLLKMTAKTEDRDEFVRECEAMQVLKGGKNLCQMHGVSVRRRPWLCIIEFLKYGDVQALMLTCKEKKYTVRLPEMLYMAKQIAAGMAHMATTSWIHMDLAARNVLVDSGLVCKVCDFGLTRKVDPVSGVFKQTKSMKLPVKWMAIESIQQRIFSEKTDVWSLGITIWEIFEYGAVPYKGVRNIQVQGHLEKGNRLPRPANCPEPVYKHVLSTFESNPHNRPDFQALATTFGRLLAANGGLEQCRDIGSELTGGKEVKATATGDGQGRGFDKRTGASLNRKSRAMSIQQSPKIKLNQNNIFTNQESDSSDDDNSFAEPSSTQHKGIDVGDSDSDVDLDEITAKPAPAASPQRKVFNLMGPGGGGEEPEAVFGSGPGPNDDADGEMSTVFNFPATNATLSENSVGMLCQVRNIPCGGTIRFVGNHHAKGDPKVLVELEQPLGRNNGVIGGHTYYACNEKHGVLCNPMDVTILKRTRQPDTAKGGCCTIL